MLFVGVRGWEWLRAGPPRHTEMKMGSSGGFGGKGGDKSTRKRGRRWRMYAQLFKPLNLDNQTKQYRVHSVPSSK